MASFVLKKAYILLNSIAQSAYIKTISFPLDSAAVDNTCMGDDDLNFLVGMKSATFSITFAADNADGDLSEDLWDIYYAAVAVPFEIKANGAVTSVTNPEYTGNCIMTSFPLVDGSVGDAATHSCTFQVTGAVARSEA